MNVNKRRCDECAVICRFKITVGKTSPRTYYNNLFTRIGYLVVNHQISCCWYAVEKTIWLCDCYSKMFLESCMNNRFGSVYVFVTPALYHLLASQSRSRTSIYRVIYLIIRVRTYERWGQLFFHMTKQSSNGAQWRCIITWPNRTVEILVSKILQDMYTVMPTHWLCFRKVYYIVWFIQLSCAISKYERIKKSRILIIVH